MFSARMTQNFFDRKSVTDRVDVAKRKTLSKFGAFVRRTARSSIRKPRMLKVSEMTPEQRKAWAIRVEAAKRAGKPAPKRPKASSEVGQPPRDVTGLLKGRIFFAYEPRNDSVVIGPEKTNTKGDGALEALEYGGESTNSQGKRVTIGPRPFMRPAFAKEQPKFAATWRDSIS